MLFCIDTVTLKHKWTVKRRLEMPKPSSSTLPINTAFIQWDKLDSNLSKRSKMIFWNQVHQIWKAYFNVENKPELKLQCSNAYQECSLPNKRAFSIDRWQNKNQNFPYKSSRKNRLKTTPLVYMAFTYLRVRTDSPSPPKACIK